MECTNDVCGMRRVGGQRRKGGMKKWVERSPKREGLLRNGFREEIGLPMTDIGHRVAVKLAVQAAKRMADRRWGERLGNDFEGNKKMFWKEER